VCVCVCVCVCVRACVRACVRVRVRAGGGGGGLAGRLRAVVRSAAGGRRRPSGIESNRDRQTPLGTPTMRLQVPRPRASARLHQVRCAPRTPYLPTTRAPSLPTVRVADAGGLLYACRLGCQLPSLPSCFAACLFVCFLERASMLTGLHLRPSAHVGECALPGCTGGGGAYVAPPLHAVGEDIVALGLPPALTPLTFVFTGTGNVSVVRHLCSRPPPPLPHAPPRPPTHIHSTHALGMHCPLSLARHPTHLRRSRSPGARVTHHSHSHSHTHTMVAPRGRAECAQEPVPPAPARGSAD
jgi:hypothetical protein